VLLQIVKVGNSKGLRIPKNILEQYHIEEEVELSPTKNGLLIKPVKSKARAGWSKKFKEMAANRDDKLLMGDFGNSDDKEWQW